MKQDYQKTLDTIIEDIIKRDTPPTLLLHSCCGPCSSYVLEYLTQYFSISVLYYNPNIYPVNEYLRRLGAQKEIIEKLPTKHTVSLIDGEYEEERYYSAVKGFENEPEGGERCEKCFVLRMEKAAKTAKEKGFDYFTTTLSVSPHKNAQTLNNIGFSLEEKYGVKYLPANFKKRNGYQRSIELSRRYGLYRQSYCGCVFSTDNSGRAL